MNDLIRLGPVQELRLVASATEALEFESTWEPGGSPTPRHWHPRQQEHFEVLDGELSVDLARGPTRALKAGDILDIPAGSAHRMWNAGTTQTRATWRITPPLRTEQMFREMGTSTGLKRLGWLWAFRHEFRLGPGSVG